MISVLKAGAYTSLQDGGRYGFRAMGVPLSGYMDAFSARYANQLLQNKPDESVLEFTAIPPTLKFEITTQIAVTGAEVIIKLNDLICKTNNVISVTKGDILTFSALKNGWRGYIAVKNGFQSQVSLNSQSQYKGITEAEQIRKGQILNIKNTNAGVFQDEPFEYSPSFYTENEIEIYKGPEFNQLSKTIQSKLINTVFTISPSSNRMAILLEEEIEGLISEIITAPVQPGTIQLTPSGKLIILMRDAQTSGGYARIFQCTEKAVNVLAQKRPKEAFSFKIIG